MRESAYRRWARDGGVAAFFLLSAANRNVGGEATPLAEFWMGWSGPVDHARAFAALDDRAASPSAVAPSQPPPVCSGRRRPVGAFLGHAQVLRGEAKRREPGAEPRPARPNALEARATTPLP